MVRLVNRDAEKQSFLNETRSADMRPHAACVLGLILFRPGQNRRYVLVLKGNQRCTDSMAE